MEGQSAHAGQGSRSPARRFCRWRAAPAARGESVSGRKKAGRKTASLFVCRLSAPSASSSSQSPLCSASACGEGSTRFFAPPLPTPSTQTALSRFPLREKLLRSAVSPSPTKAEGRFRRAPIGTALRGPHGSANAVLRRAVRRPQRSARRQRSRRAGRPQRTRRAGLRLRRSGLPRRSPPDGSLRRAVRRRRSLPAVPRQRSRRAGDLDGGWAGVRWGGVRGRSPCRVRGQSPCPVPGRSRAPEGAGADGAGKYRRAGRHRWGRTSRCDSAAGGSPPSPAAKSPPTQ